MLRKIMIASAVAFAAAAFAPTGAWAGGDHGYHGYRHHHHHWGHHHRRVHHWRHVHGHFAWRPYVRCWRWVVTPYGYRRVWVCG
jgi:hypothetical protein